MTDDATRAQRLAADPSVSTWLSANAGSGKTRVLTDRVARLLLNGVDPENILCLTYTKAAASEMQNRLFKRLGAWAMLDDADLLVELEGVGEGALPDPGKARTLFARAIETPGGLKIQTIHSFCTSILRRFPLEAGVTPRFRELDETGAANLIDDVLTDLAVSSDPAFKDIAKLYSGENLRDLGKAIASARDRFSGAPDLDALFGLPPDFDEADLRSLAFEPGDADLMAQAIPILRNGGKTDQQLADRLAACPAPPSLSALPVLERAFLTGAGTKTPFSPKIGKTPTKDLREGAFLPLLPSFEAFMQRIGDARPKRLSLDARRASQVLHAFAESFLTAFAEAKESAGVLDFDDLILRTRDLLTHADVAAWVLYRLDGGIDHILVDEAQDTSPVQWSVIMALAEEMSAGAGTRDSIERTIFVVGDKKQSIYSFQGAEPSAFDDMADDFAARLADRDGLNRRSLEYSFRSAPAILRAVDTVFDGPLREGLGLDVRHRAFHETKPGRVDLWPLTVPDEDGEPPAWYDPVDQQGTGDPTVVLADTIAAEIARMCQSESIVDNEGNRRAIHPGDILILVQGRGPLFHQIIRACKDADLPVAGADRLKVGASLAVRDLLALLSFLALPEDDLSLAAALRSPLFGWSEKALFDLAHGRPGGLWQALRDDPKHGDLYELLKKLNRQADFLRPFEVIDRILTRLGGRRKLVARLGAEAEDGINELLNQALAYESGAVPSLAGFVAWLQSGEVDVKRQSDGSGRLIRVMTVHGAKGLEAPVVILPDSMRAETGRTGSDVAKASDGTPVWPMPRDNRDPVGEDAATRASTADAEERRRLLYVAMTRAENWLITCGIAKKQSVKSPWYDAIRDGLERAGAVDMAFSQGTGLRLETGDWSTSPDPILPCEPALPVVAPDYPDATAQQPIEQVLSPSDLGGEKTMPGSSGDPDATMRGTLIHLLLERLPGVPLSDRVTAGASLLPPDAPDSENLVAEALAVLDAPDLSGYFAQPALTEVEVSAPGPKPDSRIFGTIDRLIVTDDRVTAIDFKTNRETPEQPKDTPESVKRQMGAYLHQLEQIFPDAEIELVILWTATRKAMGLPHGIVREALARATTS